MRSRSSARFLTLPALFLAMLLGLPFEAFAQEYENLRAGSRVRILAPAVVDTLMVGTLDYLGEDRRLTLIPDQRGAAWIPLPTGSITFLEVSHGRPGHGVQGALLGSLAAGGAGYALASRDCQPIVCGAAQFVGAVGGGLLGMAIGAVVGHAIPRGPERWGPPRRRGSGGAGGSPMPR